MSGFFKSHKAQSSTTSLDYRYPMQLGTPMQAGSNLSLGPSPRTPSPTPSEVEELKKGAIDWKEISNWRNWAKKKYIGYYIAIILSIVVVGLVSLYHKQIVDALTPSSQYLRQLPGGWAIPIGIMFVLSFPPLFGNEIVHVLCGIVWGLWIGFGIVCAGTFIGEIGNFYAFKYCCQARGDKLEKHNLGYACLARAVRDGGFLVAVVARLSIIPGHLTTAVFSTCGMGILSFCLGAFLSLPKQFATVYIGVVLYESAGVETTAQKITSGVVLTLTILVTAFAGWWILKKMNEAKPLVLHDRRKARAVQKMYNLNYNASDVETPYGTASSSTLKPGGGFDKPFNYSGSEVNLPLSVKPQRWDANGRAILDNSNFVDGGPGYNPRPSGAGAPNIPAMSGPPPPDIRVIRASGASTIAAVPQSPFDDPPQRPYDTTVTPRQEQYQQRPQATRQDSHPVGSGSDDGSHEGAPQWAAGMAKEDEKDVMTPLTAGMRQANLPNRTAVPVSRSSYDDVDLYTPSGHQWQQPTDASGSSFHTAEGSGSSSDYAMPQYRPNQYPPPQAGSQQQYGRQ